MSIKKNKVFMISYGGGHVNIIKEIASKLKKIEGICLEILALTTASKILDDANMQHNTISDYIDLFDNKNHILEVGKKLASQEHDFGSGIKYFDTIAYFGLGFCDLEDKYGLNEAKELYQKDGRKSFLPVRAMTTIIKNINPDIIVVTTAPRMETAAAIAANNLEIPVVRINDYPTMNKTEYKAKICVMNEWAKEYVLKNKIAREEDVEVTGQPVFESNLLIDQKRLEKYKKDIRGNYKHVVLYLGQDVPDMEMTSNKLLEMAVSNEDILFLVRPHPNNFFNYDIEGRCNFCVSKEGELKYLIAASDLIVTHTSTSGIEAALLGKPVISVLVKTNPAVKLKDFGIACEICDLDSLDEEIKTYLDVNSNMYQILMKSRKRFKNHPNAANNIVRVIMELI